MKQPARLLMAFAALAAAAPTVAYAHFKLLEPTSWILESDRGDPQKAGPCGGDLNSMGMPSNVIGKVVGGSKLHIKVQETIYHPGHYRITLAVNNRSELPPDAEVMTTESARGPQSVSAVIQNPPRIPVLADGLWPHTARVTDAFETDVTLPNISCLKCTLQVTQFMAQHAYNNPGGYIYHHCADLQITADSKKPLDKGWPPTRNVVARAGH
jgi:hypothetical protein